MVLSVLLGMRDAFEPGVQQIVTASGGIIPFMMREMVSASVTQVSPTCTTQGHM